MGLKVNKNKSKELQQLLISDIDLLDDGVEVEDLGDLGDFLFDEEELDRFDEVLQIQSEIAPQTDDDDDDGVEVVELNVDGDTYYWDAKSRKLYDDLEQEIDENEDEYKMVLEEYNL